MYTFFLARELAKYIFNHKRAGMSVGKFSEYHIIQNE